MRNVSKYPMIFMAGLAVGISIPYIVGAVKKRAAFVPAALFSKDPHRRERARNSSFVESKYFNVAEWKVNGTTYLIASEKGDSQSETAVQINASPERRQIEGCSVVDKEKASADVMIGATGTLSRIDIFKEGADTFIASDIGAKGSYDVLVTGEGATVIKDGKVYKGDLKHGNIEVERDGVRYGVNAIENVELIPLK